MGKKDFLPFGYDKNRMISTGSVADRSVLLINNPKSGRLKSKNATKRIVKLFGQTGYALRVFETQYKGHAEEIVRINGRGNDFIVCCGGDGTLNEVINGMQKEGLETAIVYYPKGTANDVAKTLNIPRNITGTLDILFSGKEKICDIGCFNGRYFLSAVTFGIGVESSLNTPQVLKNKFGKVAYYSCGVKYLKIQNVYAKIMLDDESVEGEFCFGAVLNTAHVSGVFSLKGDTVKTDDGKFEIVLVKNVRTYPDLLKAFIKLRNNVFDNVTTFLYRASEIKIQTYKKIRFLIDGEEGGKYNDVHIENASKKLRILTKEVKSSYFNRKRKPL